MTKICPLRRLMLITMAITMLLTLSACKGNNEPTNGQTNSTSPIPSENGQSAVSDDKDFPASSTEVTTAPASSVPTQQI